MERGSRGTGPGPRRAAAAGTQYPGRQATVPCQSAALVFPASYISPPPQPGWAGRGRPTVKNGPMGWNGPMGRPRAG